MKPQVVAFIVYTGLNMATQLSLGAMWGSVLAFIAGLQPTAFQNSYKGSLPLEQLLVVVVVRYIQLMPYIHGRQSFSKYGFMVLLRVLIAGR